MKVVISDVLCEGNGDCVQIAPELFEQLEDGLAVVKVEDIDESLRDTVITAIQRCPTGAVSFAKE